MSMNELYEFIILVVKTIFTAMLPLLILLIAFLLTNLVMLIVQIRLYKSSEYYAATKIPYLRMKNDTGKSGEYQTYKKLKSLGGNRKFLFNCYLPKEDGTTTEVDLIMLHESGIYVFESKNYSGWIFGSQYNSFWTQVLPRGRKHSQKERFLNPIIQNNVHIKWLGEFLGTDLPFYSFIVFSERCELKDINLTGQAEVMKRNELVNNVKHKINNSGNILTDEQIDDIYARLYPLTQTKKEQKRAHIENVNLKKQGGVRRCPRCGGNLVLRTAKSGDNVGKRFYGCSNYPRCRYTEDIPAEQSADKLSVDRLSDDEPRSV